MAFRAICVAIVAALCIGCGDRNVPSPELTSAAFNSADAPTVEFSVPDMMCPESCAVATKEILAAQPGAREVLVDFDSKSATVAIEEGVFNSDDALAALVDRGFDNSKLTTTTDSDATAPAKAEL